MSRHPDLNSYLSGVITNLRPWLTKGLLDRIVLVIQRPSRTTTTTTAAAAAAVGGYAVASDMEVVERFVIELEFITDALGTRQQQLAQQDIEVHPRAFLLKIAICDSLLAPLPEGQWATTPPPPFPPEWTGVLMDPLLLDARLHFQHLCADKGRH